MKPSPGPISDWLKFSDGIIFVDVLNHRLLVEDLYGDFHVVTGDFRYPLAVAVLGSLAYVVDSWNHRVRAFNLPEWTIALQEKAWGGYTLVVTYDYQFDPQGATLPIGGIHAVGVERETGSIAVTTAASLKLNAKNSGNALRRVLRPAHEPGLRLCGRRQHEPAGDPARAAARGARDVGRLLRR